MDGWPPNAVAELWQIAVGERLASLGESRRSLRLGTADDGCLLISGILDPIGGALVRTALEPLARKSGAHDDREPELRYADALVELASKGGKQNIQMQVTSSVETLLGLIGAPGAETDFSLPVSSKTVERWACDCSITRILMSDSVVIDVGRAERVINWTEAPCAHRPRPALPVDRLRQAGVILRGTSIQALDPRRRARNRKPAPALWEASLESP